MLLTNEKSFVRKIKEVILAIRIEQNLKKEQILYIYLNQIYLGHHAYGVQAASKAYFGKDVSKLTIGEAALLAGMTQAPGKFSQEDNSKKAKERQLYVLKRLVENHFISDAQMTEAAAQPLRIYKEENFANHDSAYLVEYVRKYLIEKYTEKTVLEDGLTVTVPIDPKLNEAAAKSLRDGLEAIDRRIGYREKEKEHLKSQTEIEEFLSGVRDDLIDKKVPYKLMMADGRLDLTEAMKSAGFKDETELLDIGENYRAVVTAVDDKAKQTTVQIGPLKATLPLDRMSWAHSVKDEKNPHDYRGEPKLPSHLLSAGDVILVKVAEKGEKGIIVDLAQNPQIQGALFSLEAQTGYVLAMQGGYNFGDSEFNRAVQAQRQPGSAFKPIVYAAALEKGYTPASIIVDSPIIYEDKETGKWKPSNFEEKFYGDTTFRQALIKSRNIPTIKLVQAIQVPYLIEYAKRLGMNSQFNADLSISLGSTTVPLMDLTRIYALFPRLGRKVTPIFISKVVDRDGKVLEENKPVPLPPVAHVLPMPEAPAAPVSTTSGITHPNFMMPVYPPADDPDQVLDPRIAYVMSHLMTEVVAYGTGHDAKDLGRPAAGKTGTTSDSIDAWFMGFTPNVVTGVWVGFDSQKPIGQNETGARAALPIWLSFMREAVKPYPVTDFTVPPGVTFAKIDQTTGKLVSSNSSSAISEAFLEGTEPTGTTDSKQGKPETQGEFFKEDL
jgi:penicillin-binding protein 1A